MSGFSIIAWSPGTNNEAQDIIKFCLLHNLIICEFKYV